MIDRSLSIACCRRRTGSHRHDAAAGVGAAARWRRHAGCPCARAAERHAISSPLRSPHRQLCPSAVHRGGYAARHLGRCSLRARLFRAARHMGAGAVREPLGSPR